MFKSDKFWDALMVVWVVCISVMILLGMTGCAAVEAVAEGNAASAERAHQAARMAVDTCSTYKLAKDGEYAGDLNKLRDECTIAEYKACRLAFKQENMIWHVTIYGGESRHRRSSDGWALQPRQMRSELRENRCGVRGI